MAFLLFSYKQTTGKDLERDGKQVQSHGGNPYVGRIKTALEKMGANCEQQHQQNVGQGRDKYGSPKPDSTGWCIGPKGPRCQISSSSSTRRLMDYLKALVARRNATGSKATRKGDTSASAS